MKKITNWRIDNENVILAALNDNGELEDYELPTNLYNEIVSSGPPTEDKKIRDIIDKIHEIREKRILYIDKILEMEEQLIKDMDDIKTEIKDGRTELKNAKDKLDVSIWKGVIESCSAELQIISKTKTILQEYRHLIKLTHQEEGKLRAELIQKLRS